MSKRIPFWLNNCVKFIFSLQVVLMFLIANGCAVGYKTGLIPRHSVDKSITSVEYYRSTMGVDLLSQDADLNDKINNKIRSARHADEIVGKIFKGLPHQATTPDIEYLKRSKRLGSNDFSVECTSLPPMEPQPKDSNLCWAACVKYLLMTCLNIKRDINEIAAERAKYTSETNSGIDSPASVTEIVNALGYSNIHVTTAGTEHVLTSLGHNLPVMVGVKSQDESKPGHAIIIVGARYSLVKRHHSMLSLEGLIAFSEFTVMDPEDGRITKKPATFFENNTAFALSFYDEKLKYLLRY